MIARMDTATQILIDALMLRLKQGDLDVLPQIIAAFNAREVERRDGVVMIKGWEAIVI